MTEINEDLPLRHAQHRLRTVGESIRFLESQPEPRVLEAVEIEAL